jgi:hypothetical protein
MGLDRYVLPIDKPVPLDADGFLDVSPRAWQPDARAVPRPAGALTDPGSSFGLLAPGGVGKTTVLDALRQNELEATDIDLRVLDKTGINEALSSAIARGHPVYLDAVDEAALHEPAVFRIIERHLKTSAAGAVSWRIACRPAAWNPDLARAFRTFLGFEELRLLPLTRREVIEVAGAAGADTPVAFVEALVSAGLARLAATPRQLETAARGWAATRALPKDWLDAIELEVRELLRELDVGRPQPRLSTNQHFRVAGRMAAMAVFGGVNRFATVAASAPALFTVSELPTSPEPDDPSTAIGRRQYEEVMGTGLFDPAPDSSVAFRHQEYAEYLAARYLTDRGITLRGLRGLLGVQADGTVAGPMIGVTGWLAALQPDLVRSIVQDNAFTLTRAGAELPSHEVRAVVVNGLLAQAAAGDIDMLWVADLAPLVHSGIDHQLHDAAEHITRPEQLWWISRLAEAAGARSLAGALVRSLLSASWPDWVTEATLTAVAALGSDREIAQLRPLLRLDVSQDPNDEVLAAGIEALFPQHISASELLEVLRPRRNTSLIGGYRTRLEQLTEEIASEDLPAALRWAAGQIPRGEDAFGSLLPRLVQRGWDEGDRHEVGDALADLVTALVRDHDRNWYRWSRSNKPPWTDDDTARRRWLAVEVSERLGRDTDYYLIAVKLLTSTDAEWLISAMPGLAEPAQAALAPCVQYLIQQPTAAVADLVLDMAEDHPAYESTRSLRDSVDIDSELARRWRELHAAEEDHPPAGTTEDERREQLISVLRETEGEVEAWWRVVYWLSVDENGRIDEPLFAHDLSTRPGWSLLDSSQQRQVIDRGLEYVASHRPTPDEWLHGKTVSMNQALPDWAGVYLLTTLARHQPARLERLRPDTWEDWATAIVGAWNYDRNKDADLRLQLVDLAPPGASAKIVRAALDHLDALDANGRPLPQQRLYEHLLPDLASALAERLAAGRYHGELGQTLLDLLVERVPNKAQTACWALARGSAELTRTARRMLAVLDGSGVVDELTAETEWAESLEEIVPKLRIDALDASRLAQLARLLLTRYPVHTDPPFPSIGAGLSAKRETRFARNRVLQRLADLGEVNALEDLADAFPDDRPVIATLLREARARAADLAFTSVTPDGLLDLLARGDVRLVRHHRDLLDAVIEQLDQIQHELDSTGVFRDIWNLGDDPRPKTEDDISDWLQRQLSQRVGNGLIVDREIQVTRRHQRGFGTRIDLSATAPTASQPSDVARITIEAKLVNNQQLTTSLKNQLVDQYLLPSGQRHGIYLVYWVDPAQRPATWRSIGHSGRAELTRQLCQQASEADDVVVVPYILDISRPAQQPE